MVRSRRALRGRDGTEHPRVFIWGLLEARLQTRGRDGARRPGRRRVAAGQRSRAPGCRGRCAPRSACRRPRKSSASRRTTSSAARRRADRGAVLPAAPGRRTGGAGALAHPAGDVAGRAGMACRCIRPRPGCAHWTSPQARPRPVRPPRPRPPVALRPRRLSVTEIETWLRDPYAIHARHVLKLASAAAAGRGDRCRRLRQPRACRAASLPGGASARAGRPMRPTQLRRAMARALAEADLREALTAWWAPRLERIADWVAEVEADRAQRVSAVA